MCKSGLVCILTSDYDPALIPPVRVEPSKETCNHTPDPQGYTAWHQWAAAASKTHAQVRCPRCGLWAIWLPKAEARAINKEFVAARRQFMAALKKQRGKR